jgi:hypothetical protein
MVESKHSDTNISSTPLSWLSLAYAVMELYISAMRELRVVVKTDDDITNPVRLLYMPTWDDMECGLTKNYLGIYRTAQGINGA